MLCVGLKEKNILCRLNFKSILLSIAKWSNPINIIQINFINIIQFIFSSVPLTRWWDECVMDCLPLSCMESQKKYLEIYPANTLNIDDYDSFSHFYKTDEFSVMSESYTFEISHSVRYSIWNSLIATIYK